MFKKRIVKDLNAKRKNPSGENDILGTEPESSTTPALRKRSRLPSKQQTSPLNKTQTTPSREQPVQIDPSPSKPEEDKAAVEITPAENGQSVKPVAANIKITTITDFQPDVCKDFLQTGYCGYGDTCKFLHIREESKQKKPVRKDWEDVQTSKQRKGDHRGGGESSGGKKELQPFKCAICKLDYRAPIKTQCGHLFCMECFLDRFKRQKKIGCFICSADVDGVMIPVSPKELDQLIS